MCKAHPYAPQGYCLILQEDEMRVNHVPCLPRKSRTTNEKITLPCSGIPLASRAEHHSPRNEALGLRETIQRAQPQAAHAAQQGILIGEKLHQ